MNRRTLIKKIDALDQQLEFRAEVISLLAQHVRLTLGRIHPAWLIGSGALIGAVAGRLGFVRRYILGMTSGRLFLLALDVFKIGPDVRGRND